MSSESQTDGDVSIPAEADVHMKIMDIIPVEKVRPFKNWRNGFAVTLEGDWCASKHRDAIAEATGFEVNTIKADSEGRLVLYIS